MEQTPTNTPIGYWLKKADHLITQHTNRVQAVNKVSRFEWQVLHLLFKEGEADKEVIFKLMRIFIDADELDATLDRGVRQGWLEERAGQTGEVLYRLTEAGARHHSIVFEAQKIARERTLVGISEDDYATTLRVLQRIVDNLEPYDQS